MQGYVDAANYVLISEGVPLVVGDIVLELERKSLTAPESYIGRQRAAPAEPCRPEAGRDHFSPIRQQNTGKYPA